MNLELDEAYRFPRVVEQVNDYADGLVDGEVELEEGDLALVAHMGKYFNRGFALALRGQIAGMKSAYDAEGPELKTPYALRDFKNPEERAWILANMVGFATTHGCTGACAWCCYDALPLGAKDLAVTPLAQKLHFFDELVAVGESVESGFGQVLVKKLFLHGDSDSFDDPDIVELVTYLYNKVGALPQLSTVVPKSGEANFKHLAALARRFSDMKVLANFLAEFKVLALRAKGGGFGGMADLIEFAERQKGIGVLQSFMSTLDSIRPLNLDLRALVLQANAEAYNQALAMFNLGTIDDYIEQGGDGFKVLESISAQYKSAVKDKFNWVAVLPVLREMYEDSFRRLGLDFATLRFDEESLAELESVLSAEAAALNGRPDLAATDTGRVRISVVQHRERIVEAMRVSGDYLFQVEPRDLKSLGRDASMRLTGIKFAESGAEVGGYGITCKQGIELTPFGVFNAVPGLVTKDYPQGRVFVPFGGLVKANLPLDEGDDLAKILDQVIVLNRGHFAADEPPEEFFVYDGDANIRRIVFNHETYRVKSDRVVMEGVSDLSVIKDFRAADCK